jgi:hypothetical protein
LKYRASVVWFLSNISLRLAVALIVPVLFVLLAGTWLTAKRLTDDLLKKDATEDARAWAARFVSGESIAMDSPTAARAAKLWYYAI